MGFASANRLRELRQDFNLTQEDLADELRAAGFRATQPTISRWEDGTTSIPDAAKGWLADRFHVSVVWLLRWENGAPENDNSNNGEDGQEKAA